MRPRGSLATFVGNFFASERRAILSLIALRACAIAVVIATGFRAISDDDFARVAIAQEFAETPSWDPSGTSWLPFPFWLNGVAMLVLGSSYRTAQGVAIVTSLLSVWLVYRSARLFGFSSQASVVGTALVAVLPHAVWLSTATVPEGFTAALALFALAAACARQASPRLQKLGALCGLAAALSRYEAWPVVAMATVFHLATGVREPARLQQRLSAAAISAAGPLIWLLHGTINHDDATFFVTRVAAYRQAVGEGLGSSLAALAGYPQLLFKAEPELMSLLLLAVAGTCRRSLPPHARRLLLTLGASLLFLIYGDLRDGAPTHHPERPLLFIWQGSALLVGSFLLSALRRPRLLAGVLTLTAALFTTRDWFTRHDGFVDREQELAIGELARPYLRPGEARMLVDSPDFSYFAVIAGCACPAQAAGLNSNDPRLPSADVWTSPKALSQRLTSLGASWLVVRAENVDKSAHLGAVVASTRRYALLRLARVDTNTQSNSP